MHMSVYGTNNHSLPTSIENLNLCFDFSQKNGVCVCVCACVCVCVFKEGGPDKSRGGSGRFGNFNLKGD